MHGNGNGNRYQVELSGALEVGGVDGGAACRARAVPGREPPPDVGPA